MNLELRHLRYFLAVAEELNFTRAAERLHMAQPALSARVREIERGIGVALFHRTTRSVQLTAAGRALLPHARRAVAAAERGLREARRASRGEVGELTIGMIVGTQTEATTQLLARFSERCPDVQIRLEEHDFSDPSAGLRSGRADVAIVVLPIEPEGLSFRALEERAMLAILPSTHALADRDAISIREILDERWIVAETGDAACRDFWLAMEHRERPPIIGPATRSLDKLIQLVSAGQVVSLAGDWVEAFFRRPGIAFVPVRDVGPLVIALGWRTGDLPPAGARLLELAKENGAAAPARGAVGQP